jgi:hypothetical protein
MFSESSVKLDRYELLLFASPEERCLYGLNNITHDAKLCRAWLIGFDDDYSSNNAESHGTANKAIGLYQQNRQELETELLKHTSQLTRLNMRLNVLEPFEDVFGTDNPFRAPLVVDISCAPRGHLLALLKCLAQCQRTSEQHVVLIYSLVKRQAATEDFYSYGMQDVVVVPGYPGQIRLKHDLLILALGFEGNRAFSLYRRLAPNMTFLIVGETGEPDAMFYREQALTNNHGLIHIYGNQLLTMPSRDPYAFCSQFARFLAEKIKPLSEKFNVYFSCLGTKLQTVGAFLALTNHPYVQVVDSLPTKRGISCEGARGTRVFDLGTKGLLEPQ